MLKKSNSYFSKGGGWFASGDAVALCYEHRRGRTTRWSFWRDELKVEEEYRGFDYLESGLRVFVEQLKSKSGSFAMDMGLFWGGKCFGGLG
ncbi:hypothetical protein LWI28_001037 [Acer negundo]|uniref:Uncharacterized protein n=1 Tax=Acer negundo TaxID=4023 RepID=A0AAD5IYE5_ACENE|nr:hypothetical protein LWI28_001037 [Acer negundo]KAK4847570.1 hypothetical protein QYF36_003411 [Acer negundo]